jgi:hypothetical protein
MKQQKTPSNTATTSATSVLCLILLALASHGQDIKSNTVTVKPSNVDTLTDVRNVMVGSFTVKVPKEWTTFATGEAASLRRQYLEQSSQIYQQFSGSSDDPAKSVDVAAFHIAGDDGAFILVSFTVPSQANLIPLLKSQAADKADWGVRNGYIRKYLGLVPIDNENLSGFYVKNIGKSGNIEVSGGLEHKKLKNTIIQLTVLSPKAWDEAKATNSLSAVLKSVVLKEK